MSYEVWAPRAKRLSVEVAGVKHLMSDVGDGWWAATVAPDTDAPYGFVVDDDETAVPDPRSRRQPEGVHGMSVPFDATTFAWTDAGWTGRQLAGGVIYELHIGTFTPGGTLDSAIGKLDHLVSLGIDFVEVLPVNGFNGTHNWGYDGVLWYTVAESYGGPAAYQRFVDACHSRGLAVIQDVVYNHLGPSGNYLSKLAPITHAERSNTWGASINLDEAEVRRYILDNVAMWLGDYHVDGLRLDAVHALIDTSDRHILKQIAEETGALSAYLGKPLTLIAESDLNDPTLITPREGVFAPTGRGGFGLDAQWSDDFHHAVHVALTRETAGYYSDFEPLEALAKVMTSGFFHDGTYSSFRGREHGHPVNTAEMPTWRLVVANQNHDQIGNRAVGDRLTATLDYGQLAIAAVLTLVGPFTPMLFMGEEWGATTPWQFFTSHPEPELGEVTAKGRIEEFAKMGWDPAGVPDPQNPSTFTNSKLDWSESTDGDHARLLALYRDLATLRRTVPELTDPRFSELEVQFDESARWFVLRRGEVFVAVNFAEDSVSLPQVSATEVLLATDAGAIASRDGVTLPGHSALIVA